MSTAVTNQNIDDNLLLGYLYFYNLGKLQLTLQDLIILFKKNGLDTGFIRPLENTDAFKRSITKCNKNIKVLYNNEEVKGRVEFDNIKGVKGKIVRLVSRKIVNSKDESISFEVIGKVSFNKKDYSIIKQIDTNYLGEYSYDSILDEVEDGYNEGMNFYCKETVRQAIQNVIKYCYPIDLLPSGICKFIPKTQKELLFGLQNLVGELNNYGEDCNFEVIPIADTVETRQSVNKALQNDVKTEIEDFINDVSQKLSEKKSITSRMATSYIDKFKYLKEMIGAYEGNLDVDLEDLKEKVIEMTELVSQNEE